jgi:hypothetical protein
MACLPLIERELRVSLRKQRPAKTRFKVAFLATVGAVFFLLMDVPVSNRYAGRSLEQLLCIAGFYFVLRAPMLTASVLAEERRNDTLGLLFLSGLGAGEVFAGKFLSSTLVAFTNLLAIFPMLALPFLIGGVPFNLFLATVCALPVLMLLAVTVSLFASTLSREDGAAVMLANVMLAMLCLLPYGVHVAVSHLSPGGNPSAWWLRLSPAYGPRLIWSGFSSGFRPAEQAEFWKNLGVTIIWCFLAFGAAAFALNRLWREREQGQVATGWRARWHDFVHGTSASRHRLSKGWLDTNPFTWLAGRDRQLALIGAILVGGVTGTWSLSVLLSLGWPSPFKCFIAAILLNSIVSWLGRYSAAKAVGEARRDDAYELLLTTPLSPYDIVWGTLASLGARFRPLANFIFGFNVFMMIGGLLARSWNTNALFVYFTGWLLLLTWSWRMRRHWIRAVPVMWASLNCGRPALAVWRTSGFNSWSWIGLLTWAWLLSNLSGRLQRFPTGSWPEIIMCAWFLGVWLAIRAGRLFSIKGLHIQDLEWDPEARVWRERPHLGRKVHPLEARLIHEFREIVREPLPDPKDPRFKRWSVQNRFPWGWEIIQQQLHEQVVRKRGTL